MIPDATGWPDARTSRAPSRSMIGGGGSGAAAPFDGSQAPTVVERAQRLRADLDAHREVDALLAEVTEIRARTAVDVEAVVAEAEAVAAGLVDEARREAERLLRAARAEADRVAARAAEDRARLRAEVEIEVRAALESERARSLEVLGRAGGRLRDLALEIEDTMLVVVGAADALPDEPEPEPEQVRVPAPAPEPVPEPESDAASGAGITDLADLTQLAEPADAEGHPEPATEPRPLGWLFRSQG